MILVVTFIRALNRLYLVGGVMTPPYERDAQTKRFVILSERGESKDPGTDLT